MKSITSFDEITLENILAPENLAEAAAAVRKIRLPTGVDGMHKSNLNKFLEEHQDTFTEIVLNGRYSPGSLRVVQKKNERRNPFLVPCVKDRFLQQALIQVMWPMYEPQLSKYSFGYRPTTLEDSEVQAQAIDAGLKYIADGYDIVIKVDLNIFFRTASQNYIIKLLSEHIKDERVVALLHKMMKAPPFENGERGHKIIKGLPHGSIIRPLLTSIVFNELDQFLIQSNYRFVRHEDELRIFTKSQDDADSIQPQVAAFILDQLHLALPDEAIEIHPASKIEQLFGSINRHLPPDPAPESAAATATATASASTASSASAVQSTKDSKGKGKPPKSKQSKHKSKQQGAAEQSANSKQPGISKHANDAKHQGKEKQHSASKHHGKEHGDASSVVASAAASEAVVTVKAKAPHVKKHHEDTAQDCKIHKHIEKNADGKYNLHQVHVSKAENLCTSKDLNGAVVKVQHRKKRIVHKPTASD